MAKASRESAKVEDHGAVESRKQEAHGYTMEFVTFREEIDSGPMLKGLPGDSCSCPHWGYVFKGKLTMGFDGREENYEAGDAFYAPPGHVLTAAADTEYLQFSPTDELAVVEETIARNMQRMQAG